MQQRFGEAFTSLPDHVVGAKSEFMETFEMFKRGFKGKNKSKNVFKLPLKMKMLDENDEDLHRHYDFFSDKIIINR
jgi:hypothetical protein